jgi:hypothetical protein
MIPKPLSESQLALLRQVHYGTRELLKAEMGRGAPRMFDPLRQRGQPIDPNTFERFTREGLIQNVKGTGRYVLTGQGIDAIQPHSENELSRPTIPH